MIKSLASKAVVILAGLSMTLIWYSLTIYGLFPLLFGPRGPHGDSEPWQVLAFFRCVWAPIWEEAAYRYAPITLAKNIDEIHIWPIVVIASALFGWQHSGPSGVLFQGVMGLIFSWVYIRNGYCYWSAVILHATWNILTTVYGL